MHNLFSINEFVASHITGRKTSLFAPDVSAFRDELVSKICNKSILVIGGAGTIGSHFIKALLPYLPSKLIVIDTSENNLAELIRTCRSQANLAMPETFKTYPIDFDDPIFIKIFRTEGPFDIVANFAAHKHVRSEKDIFSVEAMIHNNVFKAKKLLDLLMQSPPQHFFCVSTDKAASPANVMGASKKLMEEIVLSYNDIMKVSTARFANVAFSNGSLLAGFIERIFKREPLSCPANVKRYFLSPFEAGEICLLASVLSQPGDIFFPKLNSQLHLTSFKEITLQFLHSLHLVPEICTTEDEARQKAALLTEYSVQYPVFFFDSNTSGEKLFEEFHTPEEEIDNKRFSSVGVIKNSTKRSREELESIITNLKMLFKQEVSKAEAVALLQEILPTFSHLETGISLDQKM